jgi:Signal transduction histidine kinase
MNFNPFSRMSLTSKITGWFTLFLLSILLLFSVFILEFTDVWEEMEIQEDLVEVVVETANEPEEFRIFQEQVHSVIYGSDGTVLKGIVPEGFPEEVAQSFDRVSTIAVGSTKFYYFDATIRGGGAGEWVRGIASSHELARKTDIIFTALFLGSLFLLLVGSYGGYLLIRRSLKPIRAITQTAAEIAEKKDLSTRISQRVYSKDEIFNLTETLNNMLGALEESSNREKQFSSDISHELRTPLSVIQAESDYGKNYISSIDEAKESFGNIFNQSKFMTAMISQLLDIARLDHLTDVEMVELSLSELVERILKGYVEPCKKLNIHLSSGISEGLIIKGNSLLLEQAIKNLLDNAVKFTKNQIHVVLLEKNESVRLIITDNGHGIQSEEVTKIWNRFYQAERSRNKSANQGIGLGLYFVKNVIQLHKGNVSVLSEPEIQTQFSIELKRFK